MTAGFSQSVTCFLVFEIFLVFAEHQGGINESKIKNLEDLKLDDSDILSSEKTPEAQRKRDPGYYYSKTERFTFGGHHGYPRPGYSGRIVNRLQNQVNRPFKHYGPPNQQGPAYNYEPNKSIPSETLSNQDIPSPIRDTDFVEESPIASQNNQPFGQHTANYLPPQNQKLPASNAPHLFSNQHHDFSGGHQQFQNQQQSQRLQLNNQNSLSQDFDTANPNDFQNQQISDAAIFLSQNAQAISNLYGAPAPNENYAPHNQEFEQIESNQRPSQHNSQSLNFQAKNIDQSLGFQGQLPSYASGLLNTQETLEKIQSLEKDRIIAQLQQALSNRESAARHNENINDYSQRENLQVVTSQIPSINEPSISQQTPFLPTSTSSTGYQGFYAPPRPVTTTALPPVSFPTTVSTTTTHPPNHGFSGSGSTQIGNKLPVPSNSRPTIVNAGFPQYAGFVPTFVSTGFIPSSPAYATTLIPTTSLKPADNSPTHFGIPIPTLQGPKPPTHQPPSTTPATTKPSNIPSRPSTPTFSIPLGPVPTFLQPPIVKPKPIPVIPAATPVHPTYGIHPAVVNPSFVYKPVKVFPVYYYPNIAYQSIHKPVASIPTHPWSYAPSFTQTKPSSIWK
ncbi:integrator complex subunit 3 homolog [Nasonia vitripennis]|uniref:Uncharacterized protein n=1 Tax=Nasonia vitripennis TaxID=7425 RepID=A0A7M7Q7X7_NASVI|nr:integrator complex subunit 3 homolog [Nasonia vitripennis]